MNPTIPSDPTEAFVLATVTAANRLMTEANRLFRIHGLTAPAFNVLNLLEGNERGLSPGELARLLVVNPSSSSVMLEPMVRKGWIRRVPDPEDRRIHRVVLTSKGARLHASVAPRYRAVLAEVGSVLGPELVVKGRTAVETLAEAVSRAMATARAEG